MKKLPIAAALFTARQQSTSGVLEPAVGLVPVSSHVGYEQLTEAFEGGELQPRHRQHYCLSGCLREFVVEEGWKRFATKMTALGRSLPIRGHDWDTITVSSFKFAGKYALDIFFNESDPVMSCPDRLMGSPCVDPAAYLRQFKGRCPLACEGL